MVHMTDTVETALDQVTDTLKAVVRRQHYDQDPAHEDFYTWGWALSELTMRTQEAGQVLGRQVAGYGSQRILRDDEDGHDPATRLQEAGEHLREMVTALDRANQAARAYHSAIGHIGVQVDPEAEA